MRENKNYIKVWVYYNENKLPGIIVDGQCLVYHKNFWFHIKPDKVEQRVKPLNINRLSKLKNTNIQVDKI